MWTHVAAKLFLDRQAAFWRDALWDRRARVVAVCAETHDTKTFLLAPRVPLGRHRAGQFVPVTLELDGVRVRRCYSISSAPGAPHVAITVKRQSGGRASAWLHDRVGVGDSVELGAPAGDFVLPPSTEGPPLFLSGGSGVTPIMAMLRQLARERALGDVVVVHHARHREDIIFRDALEALAAEHPGLRLIFCLSEMGGRFDEERFARLVPDYATRSTFLCGPPGLMARVEAMWRAAGAEARLAEERFVLAPRVIIAGGERVRVTLARSQREVEADTDGTLLEQLERAGVRPAYGCRMGICHTCRCRKRGGVVENRLTGAVSTEAEEDIQLCISIPRSNLELSL